MNAFAEHLRRLREQAGASIEARPGPVDADIKVAAPSGSIATQSAVVRARDPAQTPCADVDLSLSGLKDLLRRHARKSRTDPVDAFGSSGHAGPRPVLAEDISNASCSIAASGANAPQGVEIATGLHEYIERLPLRPPAAWQWLPDLHPRLLPTDALLHFDTETTGLAGGTGTRAFMLGYARWMEAGLEVRQLWISRLAAESAMLERFAQWLSCGAFQLVSYNGRSFDGPLLRARYRLVRQRDPLQQLPHHDLLHAVRRRFRREWPSCRLAEAESRLLGVQRLDDLPGAQVPAAFLDTLRSGDPRALERVRRHHFQDLVSLAGLLPRLCELAAVAPRAWSLEPQPGSASR